ncbi:MAG: Spy/CpxP family protein refolding chaperone [Candidatus Aminicenantes bacterium]|nr:Spy/CpxP family protein refolding chaperone [Candidatus Aminicenantes bacterium]
MKKLASISILSLFLIATLCLANAWAQEPPERPLRTRIRGMLEEIKLTEQQREDMAKLRLENQKEMIKLRADLRLLQLDLSTLLDAKEPDKAKVYAQIDKINNLRNEMTKKRIDYSLKRRAILTPEQWEKIKDLRKPIHGRRMLLRHRDQLKPIHGRRMLFRQREHRLLPRLRERPFWPRRWEE